PAFSSGAAPAWVIRPLRAGCFAGALTGSLAGSVVVVGSVASTAGWAPSGAGGSSDFAVAGATSARGRSFGRGMPANGTVTTEAALTGPVGLTLSVFTRTRRIGSLDPGEAAAAGAAGGGFSCAAVLLALARPKRSPSFPGCGCASATGGAVRWTIRVGSTLDAGASAISGAVRLVEAEAKCSLI